MKGYSLRNEKIKKLTRITIFFAIVIVIGLLLPRVFGVIGSVVMTPIHGLNQWYETSEQLLPTLVRDRQELISQIETLENELIIAQGEHLTLRRLQEENQRLRLLLNNDDEKRTLARVLARPDEIPYDIIQINQGSEAGITENALVYIGADQLIGSVTQVAPHHSFVQLFTTPGVEMTGFISGPDVTATVEGIGGGVARVRVPQGIPLSVGNLVYVPSIQPGLFGEIGFIENRPSQPEQFGYITVPIALQSLHEVAVAAREIEPATVETINAGREQIIAERLLVEESHTASFEELLATSTPTTTPTTTSNQSLE